MQKPAATPIRPPENAERCSQSPKIRCRGAIWRLIRIGRPHARFRHPKQETAIRQAKPPYHDQPQRGINPRPPAWLRYAITAMAAGRLLLDPTPPAQQVCCQKDPTWNPPRPIHTPNSTKMFLQPTRRSGKTPAHLDDLKPACNFPQPAHGASPSIGGRFLGADHCTQPHDLNCRTRFTAGMRPAHGKSAQ